MAKVTIEGSITPSAFLARGERAEVQRTEHVERLIEGGYVVVIDADGEPEAPPVPDVPKPPSKNASTEDWRAWLDAQEPPVEYPEDASRDALVGLWEQREDELKNQG